MKFTLVECPYLECVTHVNGLGCDRCIGAQKQQANDLQQFASWLRKRGLDHTAEALEAAAKEAMDA